ncbi:platelet endothelial cell adhesion molecule [Hoplias malabaricus]|uniref:platelet endothelial cell adhesion molecule n=1 Tax=Hoplias malabaricus TaxID=27720 RepID=UPI003463607C
MTKMSFLQLLVVLGLCSMWKKTDGQRLGKPTITGPNESPLSTYEEIFCKVDDIPEGVDVLYELFKEGDFERRISEYSALYGEPGKFNVPVKSNLDGMLICKASGHNNTAIIPSYSDPMRFKVIVRVQGVFIKSEPPSQEFLEGESVTLRCTVEHGTYMLYDWLLDDAPVQLQYNRSHNYLSIHSLSSTDSGKYSCVVSNQLNGTVYSNSTFSYKTIRVKERLSAPEVTYELSKDEKGLIWAAVTCESNKGTLPVNTSLLRNNEKFEEKSGLRAVFEMPIQPDNGTVLVRCLADDGTRTVRSSMLNLTIESVGGAVNMDIQHRHVEHHFEVSVLWLRCSVERGTFVHYSWFFNNTKLKRRGTYHNLFEKNDAVLVFYLVPETDGFYHCEAANTFDNTTSVQSQRKLVNTEVLNRIPLHLAAIVFTCFILLIVAVTLCCLYGFVLRRRKTRKYRDIKDITEMSHIYEYNVEPEEEYDEEVDEELVLDAYEEDADVVEASRIEDSDEDEISIPEEYSKEEDETSVQEDVSKEGSFTEYV